MFDFAMTCRPLLVAGLLLSMLAGCEPHIVRYSVAGVVTLDGKPVKGASLTCMPRGKGRPGIGETDLEGRFTLRDAGMHDGLPPGDYDVGILLAVWSKTKTTKIPSGPPDENGKPAYVMEVIEVPPYVTKWIVPERYSQPGSSGLSVSITGPVRDLAFALTTAP